MNAQRLSLDRISTLPPPIIETILCCVPIKEAVRTSILSREWRYHWTRIPKLEFDDDMFEASAAATNQLSIMEQTFNFPREGKWMIRICRLFNAIYQALLSHQGPLLEFTLITSGSETCAEIDKIISHLSRRNTVKKFRLHLNHPDVYRLPKYRLPLSIFSLRQLTDLHLYRCHLDYQPTFSGFGSLTSLYLYDVKISTKSLIHLVSSCPLLKSVTLFMHEIFTFENDDSTMIELLKGLPLIENLHTSTWLAQDFLIDPVLQELPISLVHLKVFHIEEMCLFDSGGLPFLMLLMSCSPNLEKIVLEIYEASATDPVMIEESKGEPVTIFEDYPDIWLEQMNELEIDGFIDFKLHLEVVKFILAKSPVLKKLIIWLHDGVTEDEEANISKILLQSQRASPVAEIIIDR